jgi:hypothetical protein
MYKKVDNTYVLGYKGFNADLVCRDMKYVIGEKYSVKKNKINLCSYGFHFCEFPLDVFTYCDGPDKIYGIVKAEGKIIKGYDKSVCSKITLLATISKDDLMRSVNGHYNVPYESRWYKNGLLHNISGPAQIYADGRKCWYENGILHRENGPAIEFPNGEKQWYYKGKQYRVYKPPTNQSDSDVTTITVHHSKL